jgi:hypothetical protein
MPGVRPLLLALLLLALLLAALLLQALLLQCRASPDPLPTAEAIMARVSANQDRSEAERDRYVYVQHARVVSRKSKTVMCEEVTDSRVTPSAAGSHQELLKLDGRLLKKHKYVTYTSLPPPKDVGKTKVDNDGESLSIEIGGGNADRDMVEHMRSNLTNDKSKDGIGEHLFPLTSKSQSDYRFQLIGREHMHGHDVFHISFFPKDKNDYGWKGDAYIDTTAYQPVLVEHGHGARRSLRGPHLAGHQPAGSRLFGEL